MLKILTRGHGATVACLTPDQQVGGSNPSVLRFLLNLAIEYHYYSKRYSNTKAEAKKDNKGIKLIKEFLLTMYKKLGAENNKRDDE